MSDSALHVAALRVRYGRTEAVRDVSFSLAKGEKLGVVGESGCGKSTLAAAVIGLLPGSGKISEGSVTLGEVELTALPEKRLNDVRGKDISLIFQDPLTSLDPVESVGTQIAETIKRHNPKLSKAEIHQRAVDLMTAVGIPEPAEKIKQYPHEFSGGMRQRVLIAIAIANDPSVVIADEPTTALDVTTQAQVMELLDELVTTRDIAVILISHDIGLIAQFCDRILVMYAGVIVEDIASAGMLDKAIHPYSVGLIDALPLPGRRGVELAWIRGLPPNMAALPPGCAFAPRCDFATAECSAELPPLTEVPGEPGHLVGCFHPVQRKGGKP